MSLLVANLDAELALARALTPGPHKGLPAHVRAAVAPVSAHMALLGRPGDRLWTMAPIDPAVVERVAPGVEAASGELVARPGEAVLAWCETEAIAALRREAGPPPPRAGRGWVDRLWTEIATPEAAARANDRRLSAALAGELGVALPGSRLVSSVAELEAHVAGAPLGAGEAWVAKAPLSAAGRERLRRRGRNLDVEARVRADRLLSRYGQLCFEPWVERVADLGRAGVVGDQDTLFPPHRMECDGAGVVRAILVDDEGVATALDREQRRALDRAAEAAMAALRDAGYRGPFSVDAFLYRSPSGAVAVQPLVEINARLSFGHLARAAAERAGSGRFRLPLGAP